MAVQQKQQQQQQQQHSKSLWTSNDTRAIYKPNYLKITTTFTDTLLFYQIILQYQNFIPHYVSSNNCFRSFSNTQKKFDLYNQKSEAMYNPSDQIYDKQHKIFKYLFDNQVKQMLEKCDQRF